MTGSLRYLVAVPVAVLVVGLAAAPAVRAAPGFTSSAITSPATGDQLYYDADAQSGAVLVQGAVSPGVTTTGTLICWSALRSYTLATRVPVSAGTFEIQAPLTPEVAGEACRLAFVPSGLLPAGDAIAPFTGPVIVVSEQQTLSTNSGPFGYNIMAGNPTWSFAFDSLGGDALGAGCPVAASDSTDQTSFGSYSLFYGDACLPVVSGLPPDLASRSSLQVSGQNAYPPGAIPVLSGRPGFAPISYAATWDLQHDTVTISDTERPMVCAPPSSYPPAVAGNCPSLVPSGIQVQQTTTLLPGAQVARVAQTFIDVDGSAHTLDLLISQAIHAYATGQVPGFELPGETQFAPHATPASSSTFAAGAGSIYVIADASQPPALANPVGAITYDQPPLSATFVSAAGAQTATLFMHYTDTLAPGGSFTLNWAFSQAASSQALAPLVQVESDRFYTPNISIAVPASGLVLRQPLVSVTGTVQDPEGIAAVAIDGREVPAGAGGSFTTAVPLRLGPNTIEVTATNLAGITATADRLVVYTPTPCVVPRVKGRTLTRARAMIASHGCSPGRVLRVRSRRIRRGHVISISPRVGSHHSHGTRVLIKLSAGAPRSRRR